MNEIPLGVDTRGPTILIEGLPRTGKTLLSLHFLIAGILENPKDPEPAILVCLDESEGEQSYSNSPLHLLSDNTFLHQNLSNLGNILRIRTNPFCQVIYPLKELSGYGDS